MLKIPKGQERSGIKIKCKKCDRQVKDICPLTGKKMSTCKFKNRQKYILVYHIPGTDDDKTMKTLDTRNFDEAVVERARYKLELEKNNYHKVSVPIISKRTSLYDLSIEYLDTISGNNPLEYLNNKLDKGSISNAKLVLGRFSECMKKQGFKISKLDVKDIGDIEANNFLLYLREYSKSKDLHDKHFVRMKTFFNWIIDIKGYKIANPFRKATLKFKSNKDNEVVSYTEFEALLRVVTPKNGYQKFKTGREKGKNLYRTYLLTAFKLALETGCRAEELVKLRWSHLRVLPNGAELFHITNHKVAAIQAHKSNKVYKRPIPITRSLKTLLIDIGYYNKRATDEYVLERPEGISETYLKGIIGRAFNHYIKLVNTNGRKIEFKNLRKTYITAITMALGTDAKIFTGHADDKIIEDHYLDKKFVASKLTEFRIFNNILTRFVMIEKIAKY
jgi:integrase